MARLVLGVRDVRSLSSLPTLVILVATAVTPTAVLAQDATSPRQQDEAAAAPSASGQPPGEGGGARRFVDDVLHDYRNFFSWETAAWLGGGGLSALSIHVADETLREATQDPEAPAVRALDAGEAGATYGNLSFQFPLAVGWWVIGHAAGSSRAANAGRDLVRAQISGLSWAYAVKYPVDRTRPNGDPRSFPSGHATAAFATAMVIQEHYGWKLGLPFFVASGFTAASRITVNKHWASDVVFGAYLGMAAGRTVTLHVRNRQFAMTPMRVPGGGGVQVRVTDRGQ